MDSKENAFLILSSLVERFAQHLESHKKMENNETLVRRDFIDPFFKALGWDVDNSQGYSESYREVVHEEKIKVSKETKAPDYTFRIGGKRLFFVEAKKPSIYVKEDISVAYQVRRYGWSAKLAISIVTDFEEFAVYDCTIRPRLTDKASTARIRYITFQEYLKEFEFLWNTFSKEGVLKGGLEKFIQTDTQKKGTSTVDKEFLNSLDTWRKYLASAIITSNHNLEEEDLNYVVQQIIDRIVFLRIAEDRSVEHYGTLKDTIQHGNYYENLVQLFKRAAQKYNSGLFDFEKDTLSDNLK
ncbi:MAG: type I restriction enzyme HsdR N-terminal domain-containing protein, partial [Leptospiraceae bacterium]|nr:type I restriction enzyme HsdR N-terminal domain-containing protein [Leptospiraceae bacterium]